jgi:hypothetical protein
MTPKASCSTTSTTDGGTFRRFADSSRKSFRSNPMHLVNDEMKRCIAECLRCYQTCLSTAMGHCLEIGGQHTEPQHFSLMMACAEICRTSAHFMLLGSELHKLTCRECAEICERCAADCERVVKCGNAWMLAVAAPKAAKRWLPEWGIDTAPVDAMYAAGTFRAAWYSKPVRILCSPSGRNPPPAVGGWLKKRN